MREDASDTSDDEDADRDKYAYTVGSATKTKLPSVQLLLNRIPVTFLVDSVNQHLEHVRQAQGKVKPIESAVTALRVWMKDSNDETIIDNIITKLNLVECIIYAEIHLNIFRVFYKLICL